MLEHVSIESATDVEFLPCSTLLIFVLKQFSELLPKDEGVIVHYDVLVRKRRSLLWLKNVWLRYHHVLNGKVRVVIVISHGDHRILIIADVEAACSNLRIYPEENGMVHGLLFEDVCVLEHALFEKRPLVFYVGLLLLCSNDE